MLLLFKCKTGYAKTDLFFGRLLVTFEMLRLSTQSISWINSDINSSIVVKRVKTYSWSETTEKTHSPSEPAIFIINLMAFVLALTRLHWFQMSGEKIYQPKFKYEKKVPHLENMHVKIRRSEWWRTIYANFRDIFIRKKAGKTASPFFYILSISTGCKQRINSS